MTLKKIISVFIFLFLISGISVSQNLRELKSLNEIDSIRTSLKGNVILVNFWASWCKPCVEEFPDLLKLKRDYEDKGLSVILISLDFPEDVNSKLKPFLKKDKADFTTFYNGIKNADSLMEYIDKKWDGAIPATFIFDRKGQMKTTVIGSHDYEFYKTEVLKLLN